jgi:integrase
VGQGARPVRAFPYLYRDLDRQGALRWRLRAPGRKTVTIKGSYGSAEFAANYRAATEGEPVEKSPASRTLGAHGTIGALAHTYLGSAAFAELALASQRNRRAFIEALVTTYGTLPIARLERRHVRAMMDANVGTPGKARAMLSALRALTTLAVEDGTIAVDPAAGIKRPRLSQEGIEAWTEGEIAAYEAHHPIGTPARLAFALAIFTGQRASDLIHMGRQHVRDGAIELRQQKTKTALAVPLHPELRAIIDASPATNLLFLVTEHGKPYASANSFGQQIRRWAQQAGINGRSIHGLRKTCCRRLAEAGCSAHEIMSISGHKTLAECERYTKSASQRQLAEKAIARTESYPR